MRKGCCVVVVLATVLVVAILLFQTPAFATSGSSFLSLSYDGTLWNSGSNYATVQNNRTAIDDVVVEYTGTSMFVGQSLRDGTYNIYRSVLFFDTSQVPVGAAISSAYVTLYGRANYSTTDFDIVLVSPGDMHTPLEEVDYAAMRPYTTGLNQVFNSASYGRTMRLDLNGTGINSIIHSGVTKFGLRSARDISAIAPTDNEYIEFYSSESAYAPTLTVTYHSTGQLGRPSVLSLTSCAVYNGYREDGDQLWVCRSTVKYHGGIDDLNSRDYWQLQILDGDTIKAAVPLWSWGYVPASIYLSASNALPWGGVYSMRLIGSELKYDDPVPYVQYTLTPSDFKGADHEGLDSWCMATALDIGRVEKGDLNYYRCPVSYYDPSKPAYPWRINDAGQILFEGGIPLIDSVRSHLFAHGKPIASDPSHTGSSYSSTLWDNWGSSLARDWALIGRIAGVPAQVAASAAWMMLVFGIVYVVNKETGKPILGMIPGIGGIILGTMLGAPNIVVILSILALGVIYLAYELVPTRT